MRDQRREERAGSENTSRSRTVVSVTFEGVKEV